MKILSIRTDNPQAEIGLFEANNSSVLEAKDYLKWEAHRILAETLLPNITDMIKKNNIEIEDLDAIVCFKGPGSFTGLRIGLSVANTLAYSLSVPIIGQDGDDWLKVATEKIVNHDNDHIVLPFYGAPVHITQPKK